MIEPENATARKLRNRRRLLQLRALDANKLSAAIESLRPRHQYVVNRRYGLDGNPPATLAEIGKVLKLSRLRINLTEGWAMFRIERYFRRDGNPPDGDTYV